MYKWSNGIIYAIVNAGIVHSKRKSLSLITLALMSFQTVRPLFIFGTEIKIFLMKSESSQTLHRQQRNCNVPSPRNAARTSVKQSMWHQGINSNFTKLREYLLCAKKTKITTLFNNSSPPPVCHGVCYVSGPGNISVALLSMEGQRALRFHQNILICVPKMIEGLKGLEKCTPLLYSIHLYYFRF